MTPEAILEAAKPELARWLESNPRVFAERVITITAAGGDNPIRVFTGTPDDTIARLSAHARMNGAELPRSVSDGIRARTSKETSAVVIVTVDGSVYLETFSWVRAMASAT